MLGNFVYVGQQTFIPLHRVRTVKVRDPESNDPDHRCFGRLTLTDVDGVVHELHMRPEEYNVFHAVAIVKADPDTFVIGKGGERLQRVVAWACDARGSATPISATNDAYQTAISFENDNAEYVVWGHRVFDTVRAWVEKLNDCLIRRTERLRRRAEREAARLDEET